MVLKKSAVTSTFILVSLLILFPVLGFARSSPSSDEKAGNPFIYRARMVDIAPVVDGVLDDPAWKEAEEGELDWNATESKPWRENGDFRGKFKVVWKGGTLYIALTFEDDRVEIASVDLSKRDSVEIYIDMDRYARKSHVNRYTVPFGENKPFDNIDRLYSVWSNDGTAFEASFTLDRPPTLGAVIGFDICYNDVDGDNRKQIRWTDDRLNYSQKPMLGDLVFEGMGSRINKKMSTTWGRIKSLY